MDYSHLQMSNPNKDIIALANRLKRGQLSILRGMGGLAVTHFKDSFTKQGFTDSRLVKWKEVRRRQRTESGKRYQYKGFRGAKYTAADRTRAILFKSGALRRSVHISQVNGRMVEVLSNMPYSSTHQFGRKKGNIPARPFMGNSRKLNVHVERFVRQSFDKLISKR
jgi:phage gpG-like protein